MQTQHSLLLLYKRTTFRKRQVSGRRQHMAACLLRFLLVTLLY